eukprot:1008128-Pelagomonas_calceolata.AAC.3
MKQAVASFEHRMCERLKVPHAAATMRHKEKRPSAWTETLRTKLRPGQAQHVNKEIQQVSELGACKGNRGVYAHALDKQWLTDHPKHQLRPALAPYLL